MARSLSMPGNDDVDCIPQHTNPYLPNGDPFNHRNYGGGGPPKRGAAGSCSHHGTLNRRDMQRHSSIGCNTTLEDEVFEDSDSAAGPPNSARPLLDSTGSFHGNTIGNFTAFEEIQFHMLYKHLKKYFLGSRLASSGHNEPTYIPLQHSSVSSTHHLRGLNGFSPRNLPLHPTVYQRRPSVSVSPPPSPIRQFSFTATLPRKSPGSGNPYHLPNGHLGGGMGAKTLGRQRSESGLNGGGGSSSGGPFRRMNSADRLTLTSGEDSPPLPPPPPPPMSSMRHLNYTSRPSMIV